uniref:conjugative transfer system coupling protein TraD n=1 Tax=uncultured Cardiobacterium sp. TaxID=417619 RepID=UPI00261D65B8
MRALFSLPFRLLRRLLRSLMLRTVADMRGGRKRYAKEALLRDIHEYTAVWAYLVGAAFLFLASEMALLVPSIAWAGSAVFLYRAWVRGCHGYYVASYQRNLTRLPPYRMESRALRQLKNQFLGMGFLWESIHAQRLYDIDLHKNQRFTRFSDGYYRARAYCNRQHHGLFARAFARYLESDSLFNPWRPAPGLEGKTWLHTVGMPEGEQPVYQPLSTRVSHTIVFGTTRVGKTRMAEVLITQDIHRGDIVIVFDPKGDRELLLRMYVEAKAAGREDQFYMFHLGFPDLSAQYNPVGSFLRVTEVATRIANQMPGEGQSAAFRDFVWRFVNVLGKMMEALSIKPSYLLIYRCAVNVDDLAAQYFASILNRECPGWQKDFDDFDLSDAEKKQVSKTGRSIDAVRLSTFLKQKNLNDAVSDAVTGILGNERSYFEKLVSSLYPLLEKLTSGRVAELISPNFKDLADTRPIMDWRKVMEQNAVVYVGLDALTDAEVAAAVGNAMFADLTSLAGQIYKHGHGYGQSGPTKKRMVAIHADEFNELIGNEFIPMLNKAGGAGYQVTAYTQTWSDVEAK